MVSFAMHSIDDDGSTSTGSVELSCEMFPANSMVEMVFEFIVRRRRGEQDGATTCF